MPVGPGVGNLPVSMNLVAEGFPWAGMPERSAPERVPWRDQIFDQIPDWKRHGQYLILF